MTDDREDASNRMKDRLGKRFDPPGEQAAEAEPSKPSEPDKPSETGETSQPGESVKEQQKGVYMYLPESQAERLAETIEEVQFFYKREYGEELEKNRHLYPLIVECGLDTVTDVADDPEEIHTLLETASVPAP